MTDQVIRMVQVAGDIYIHREDVINLIEKAFKRASSINSKSDLRSLANDIAAGEIDLDMKFEDGDLKYKTEEEL